MSALSITDAIFGKGGITQNINVLFQQIEDWFNGVTASADITITGRITAANATITGAMSLAGVTDASDAAAGKIGEEVRSSVASASAVTLTTNQYSDVTSVSLTAGDWDVSGMVSFTGGAVTGTQFSAGFGTASGNSATGLVAGDNLVTTLGAPGVGIDPGMAIPQYRINVSSTTIIYLKAFALFTLGTAKAYGRISARRRR